MDDRSDIAHSWALVNKLILQSPKRERDFRMAHLGLRGNLCLYWEAANMLQMPLSIGMDHKRKSDFFFLKQWMSASWKYISVRPQSTKWVCVLIAKHRE